MEGLPEDADARRARLERWAAVQQLRMSESERREQQRDRWRLAALPWRGEAPLTTAQWLKGASSWCADRLLDAGLGTSQTCVVPEHSHPDRVHYIPTAWHVLPRALHGLGVSDHDTFVDFGCGKGRIVDQAARRPFRRVIGVEISPVLAEFARAGLAARRHQHRCGDVEIVVADAAEFPVPDDLTVGFVFDAFRGDTLDTVLRNIIDSIDRRPRRVRLIYVHPSRAGQVLATGRFRLVREQRGGLRDMRISRAAIFESC